MPLRSPRRGNCWSRNQVPGSTENIWSRTSDGRSPQGDERAARHVAGFQSGRTVLDVRRLPAQEHHDLHDWNRSLSGPTTRRDAPHVAPLFTGRFEGRLCEDRCRFSVDGVFGFGRKGVADGRHALAVSAGLVVGDEASGCSKDLQVAYAWVEKELETGLRTGRRVQVTDDQSAVNDELECWPEDVDVTSPFFRKLRVETEETSSILRLPARRTDRLSALSSGPGRDAESLRRLQARPRSSVAFAFTALTPTIAAVATNTAVSAILLSMVSPCGFVVAVSKPTRRIRIAGRTRGEQPAHHGGNT